MIKLWYVPDRSAISDLNQGGQLPHLILTSQIEHQKNGMKKGFCPGGARKFLKNVSHKRIFSGYNGFWMHYYIILPHFIKGQRKFNMGKIPFNMGNCPSCPPSPIGATDCGFFMNI